MDEIVDKIDHYFPDMILGANDGIITTLAIVAATQSTGLGPLVVIAMGLANLFADGISMGASNYIAQRSRNGDHHNTTKTNSLQHGIATFIGFLVAGFFPLISYLIPTENHFLWSILMASIALFVVGALRVWNNGRHWIKEGLETLLIGAFAASVAYIVGHFFDFRA